MKKSTPLKFALLASVALLIGVVQNASAKTVKTREISDTVTIHSTVTAVDKAKRLLTLKAQSGEITTLTVSPEVKYYDKVRVGDTVSATLTVHLLGELRKPTKEEEANPVSIVSAEARNNDSSAPAGGMGNQVKVVTKVISKDLVNQTVTLQGQGPEGISLTVKSKDSANLKKLKIGSTIIVTYTETMVVSLGIMPAKQPMK